MNPALPPKNLLEAQAEWLAPARARLLRRVGVARRRRILDLGAGYGAVTGELARRGGGFVAALDREEAVFTSTSSVVTSTSSVNTEPAEAVTEPVEVGADFISPVFPLCGDALSLPFVKGSFDLVFCQCVLLWVTSAGSGTATSAGSVSVLATAVSEIHRVLEPGGVLIALEPDYAGMIEHPPEIAARDIWLSALARAGAEPRIGRLLPGMLAQQSFAVRVDLLDSLTAPVMTRFDFLRTLPLLPEEKSTLDRAALAADNLGGVWQQTAHLPFFCITATKT
ncbi:MAG: methyltransferase domain-containing protein [Chloroflexota bacterium]